MAKTTVFCFEKSVSLQAMMKKIMFKKAFFLILTIFIVSCNEYNKVLKSNDSAKKYDMAVKLYEEKKHFKAFPLLEELVTVYRGTDKADKIYYYYAYCSYHMGDYEYANYHFKNYVKTFSNSEFAEECFYMSAYTLYLDSPEATLDQTNTLSAIAEMQMFLDKYPESKRKAEANKLIDQLYLKLETKAYNNCSQYYKTENYNSAIIEIQNTLEDFPATKYAEELSFLNLKSNFLYAINSIETKKEERFQKTLKAYKSFVEKYPSSTFLPEAESFYSNTLKSLNKPKSNT